MGVGLGGALSICCTGMFYIWIFLAYSWSQPCQRLHGVNNSTGRHSSKELRQFSIVRYCKYAYGTPHTKLPRDAIDVVVSVNLYLIISSDMCLDRMLVSTSSITYLSAHVITRLVQAAPGHC